jgi:hypothetical protein
MVPHRVYTWFLFREYVENLQPFAEVVNKQGKSNFCTVIILQFTANRSNLRMIIITSDVCVETY